MGRFGRRRAVRHVTKNEECETDPDQTVGSEEGCWNSVLDPALARSMMEYCPKLFMR